MASEAARPGGESIRGSDAVPESGDTIDLQPDVERIHRAIRREPRDPTEGNEVPPWAFWAAIAIAFVWAGWYLGRFGGEFNTRTHIELAGRQPGIAAEGASREVASIADPVQAGQGLYTQHCQSCHQQNGQGLAGAFPPIIGSEWVTGDSIVPVRILLHGLNGPITVRGNSYNGAMPAWRDVLSDQEIAAVVTYIRQWKPNAAPAVSPEFVAREREASKDRATPWTAAELQAGVQQ
jgi:mono/diheme cytochrome c family protein